ncbi:hypothetical protein AALB39_05500 [Lachnospiraceae bacterium 54-53]
MRYWGKRIPALRRIPAYIFSLALLFSGLNIFHTDVKRDPSQTWDEPETEEAENARKTKAIAGFPGISDEEANGEMLSDAAAGSSIGAFPVKYLFRGTELLFVPLILCALLTVVLQDGCTGGILIIKYIHNSDGEKGKRADFIRI